MLKNALIITWSGFQDYELVYPYYRLLGDDFKVSVIADKKDSLGRVYGIIGLNMPCDVLISEFNKDTKKWFYDCDLFVIPGGIKSLEKLRQEGQFKDFIKKWHDFGKMITLTCHVAQMLISSKITKGRKIAGFIHLKTMDNFRQAQLRQCGHFFHLNLKPKLKS